MAYGCKYGYGECDGCGRCSLAEVKCPICGEEPEHLYCKDGEIIGCDQCIERINAEDYDDTM